MQYFYDKEDSTLAFTDIACLSARRCLASGVIDSGKHDKGVVAVTDDGGDTWQLEDVKDLPVSLFFLNENKGWMVTDRGIWETEETGRGWKKIKDLKELERVYFLDENHGYAIGAPKLVLETTDGGRKWSPLPEAAKAPTAPDNTVYHWIAFEHAVQGLIIGSWTLPHSSGEIPDWMTPEHARFRREYPSVTILLQTTDGAKTWTELSRSLDGLLTRFRYGSTDYGIALFEFPVTSELSSQVVKMNLKAKANEVIYSNPKRTVRDFAILPGGEVMIAAVEKQGKSNVLPIPGKLRMMRSSSLKTWIDMDVDYRAVASRAMMAAADANNVWVVTDTGMILKWTPAP